MAGFVQIIEMKTSRIDEIEALVDKYRANIAGDTGPRRVTLVKDRDRDGYYLNIVEFESYERAMANSDRPETGQMAKGISDLCDAPPKFYNLDLVRTEEM